MGKTIGILLAGGVGSRFKGNKPKQYYEVNGHELIWYSIEAFRRAEKIDDFVIVLNEAEYVSGNIEKKYGVHTICGGATRNHSLRNAIEYIKKTFPDCDGVIENNAACPLTKSETLNKYAELLKEYDYVQTTFKITDALGSYTEPLVNREDYFLIQTPMAYNFAMLYHHFDPESPIGHPIVQFPSDAKGYNNFEDGVNLKVTYPEDLVIVEALFKQREMNRAESAE